MLSCFRAGVRAGDLVALLGPVMRVELQGEAATPLAGVAAFKAQEPQSLSYLVAAKAETETASGQVVICGPTSAAQLPGAVRLIVADPRAAFLRLIDLAWDAGLFDPEATIRRHAHGLEPGAYEAHASAVIEGPVVIGEGARLGPNVVVLAGSILGPGVVVRSGAVIGDEGAAVHRTESGELLAQRHLGVVRIDAGCEVGVQATVVRAMLGCTRVGDGTRLGNYVNVGHGVEIGARAWIAAGSILGGHATIGEGATLGLGAIVRDNVTVGANASVGMGSVVTKAVPAAASVFGNPAQVLARPIVTGPGR